MRKFYLTLLLMLATGIDMVAENWMGRLPDHLYVAQVTIPERTTRPRPTDGRDWDCSWETPRPRRRTSPCRNSGRWASGLSTCVRRWTGRSTSICSAITALRASTFVSTTPCTSCATLWRKTPRSSRWCTCSMPTGSTRRKTIIRPCSWNCSRATG